MNSRPARSATVLALLPSDEDRGSLSNILSSSPWKLRFAGRLQEARTVLRTVRIFVVVAECDYPDGCWRDLLKEIEQMADAPALIVASRLADEALWATVLNLGGFDLLAKPFHAAEVLPIVSRAFEEWQSRALLGWHAPAPGP
ncbi:MAG: response regulator [Acidobacteria bacterium]|nr:response regulator [Acidobacteriota bacterium]